ncbi:WD40-repeat-containing domain protein [Aspergillus egyptiacus]|nr:WD40-repeat-containing domain protein [Aspergillus egyptiacus]
MTRFSRANEVCVWDVASGEILHMFDRVEAGPVFLPDSSLVALRKEVADDDIRSRSDSPSENCHGDDVPGDKEDSDDAKSSDDDAPGDGESTDCEAGNQLSGPVVVHTWYPEKGAVSEKTLRGHRGSTKCMAITPDGMLLASMVESDTSVYVYNLPTGLLLRRLSGHDDNEVDYMEFSPNQKLLASMTRHGEGIILWDVSSGQLLKKFEGPPGGFVALAFSPQSDFLAFSARRGSLELWDVSRNRIISKYLQQYHHPRLRFFTDNSRLDTDWEPGDLACAWITTASEDEFFNSPLNTSNQGPWVMHGTRRVLLVPANYKLEAISCLQGLIVMADLSGRLLFVELGPVEGSV